MSVRAIFLVLAAVVCALGAGSDPVAGKWLGTAPDLIGKTEDVALSFVTADSTWTGVLHTPDGDIKLAKIHIAGRALTFDATRIFRGHGMVYHYDGTVSGDTIQFTVQSDDGGVFFSFTVKRASTD